jgi:hypothetical protein
MRDLGQCPEKLILKIWWIRKKNLDELLETLRRRCMMSILPLF